MVALMHTIEYEHQSTYSQARLWEVFGNFLDVSWLPGPDRVVVGEYDGREARFLVIDHEMIVEYLLEMDEPGHRLRYGVLKNLYVPVHDYEAELRVTKDGKGAKVSFKAQFNLADVPEEEVRQMLSGAYQLMAESADQCLAYEDAQKQKAKKQKAKKAASKKAAPKQKQKAPKKAAPKKAQKKK